MNLDLGPVNLYTVLFVIFFGVGYGAYYSTADMPIPMVADCSDYETFRSGRYIPGIMGTLFSLVDKLVSSLGSTVVGAAVAMIGIHTLPDGNTPYSDGMHGVVIVLFCIVPMMASIIPFDCDEGVFPDRQPNERNSAEINAVRKDENQSWYVIGGCNANMERDESRCRRRCRQFINTVNGEKILSRRGN